VLLRDYLAISARYNSSANERLLAALVHLKPEFYYEPVLGCSRSIHGILNHVMAADLAWIGEMTGRRSNVSSPDDILYATLEQFMRERSRVDAKIISLIDRLSEDDLGSMIQYDDAAVGPMQWPFMLEIAHVFRHASHHRGQVTILMEAVGCEPPKIDDLFVPSDISFEISVGNNAEFIPS